MKLNIHIEDEDWSPAMGGWRCDALLLPGATLEALYHDGMKADTKSFNIEGHIIRWSGNLMPKDILATLSLSNNLYDLEEEKLRLEREKLSLQQQLERDKLSLEKQKTSVETKWKFITAIGAIMGSLLSFGAAYLVGSAKPTNPVSAIPTVQAHAERLSNPTIQTYVARMSNTEDKCLEALMERLERHRYKNITLVRMGIYATKASYNVFIGCNSDVNAVILVVSGPESSNAKKIREEIKLFLP
jgi:hypothetical protein